jgi:hypothetical protein
LANHGFKRWLTHQGGGFQTKSKTNFVPPTRESRQNKSEGLALNLHLKKWKSGISYTKQIEGKMDENQNNVNQKLEAVVGVFRDLSLANRAVTQLRGSDIELHRVSRKDPTAKDEMPEIYYDTVNEVRDDDIVRGVVKGGAIGAGSGLLFIGVPGFNVAAPIFGALAGAWIGALAGIDEAWRGVELPDPIDYSRLLAEGKSFVVISADQATRIKYAAELEKLGATEVHQHPPVLEASFHKPPSAN